MLVRKLAAGSPRWLGATLVVAALCAAMTAAPAARGLTLTLTKAFGAASIPVGGSTSLTFTLHNFSGTTQTAIAFTDTLPSGLAVATPNGLTNSCGAERSRRLRAARRFR